MTIEILIGDIMTDISSSYKWIFLESQHRTFNSYAKPHGLQYV